MTRDSAIQGRWPVRSILFFGAVGILVAHALVFNFLNDDAFISFRYADNWVRHGELVFNPGEKVEGYTNFLWTVLMAGVIALGQDPALWSRILGVAFAVGTLWVLTRFMARLRGRPGPSDTIGAGLLAAAPAYACWSMGGLETQLFTFTLTLAWTTYLDAKANAPHRIQYSSIWFALAAMTRPEGMLMLGLVVIHHLIEMFIVEKRWLPNRHEWIWAAVFLGIFGPFFAWRWSYYGWPFPNTYYVKTGASGFWGPGWRYFWTWVTDHLLWLFPILAVLGVRLLGSAGRRLLSLGTLLIVVHSIHVIRVGGDFMGLHRFLVPIMPLMAGMAALGLVQIYRAMAQERRAAVWCGIVLSCALLATHVVRVDRQALSVGSDGGVDRIGWLKSFHGQCEAIGRWLQQNAPPDASIATTAAGIIPYFSRLYTVDVLGLNDEWVAHNVPARGHRPGHTKSAPLSYILKKEVDYLIYHPTIAARAPGKRRAERRQWKKRGYVWKTVQVPGLNPPWWGYWKRERKKAAK